MGLDYTTIGCLNSQLEFKRKELEGISETINARQELLEGTKKDYEELVAGIQTVEQDIEKLRKLEVNNSTTEKLPGLLEALRNKLARKETDIIEQNDSIDELLQREASLNKEINEIELVIDKLKGDE